MTQKNTNLLKIVEASNRIKKESSKSRTSTRMCASKSEKTKEEFETFVSLGLFGELGDVDEVLAILGGSHRRSFRN